jgi:hypothetical protein
MNTREKDIVGANILKVVVGTNGYKGGDSGHGSRTHFELRDVGGTDMTASVGAHGSSIRIELGGDSELKTFIEALEFAVTTLKDQSR